MMENSSPHSILRVIIYTKHDISVFCLLTHSLTLLCSDHLNIILSGINATIG